MKQVSSCFPLRYRSYTQSFHHFCLKLIRQNAACYRETVTYQSQVGGVFSDF